MWLEGHSERPVGWDTTVGAGAPTASSAALGAVFLLLIAVVAALASGPNDFMGRLRVDFVLARCLSWPRRLNMDFTKSIEHYL